MFFRQTQIWMWVGRAAVIGAGIATGISAQAQLRGCNAAAASPSVTIALPSSTFGAKSSTDECWVFVSVADANGGIAVLKRQEGHIEMQRVVRVTPAPAGIALTHDGQLLVAAANNSVVILDVARMTAGAENPILGTFSGPEGKFLQSVYVNITADDKLLFVGGGGSHHRHRPPACARQRFQSRCGYRRCPRGGRSHRSDVLFRWEVALHHQ